MAPLADQPFPLNPTCKTLKLVGKKPETLYMADEMVKAHNGLIRALNSMYLQAPYVSLPKDIRDLCQYTIFWDVWIHHHHEGGNTWPPVPWFVNYLVHYWFERKHASVWRFSPCTTWFKRRPLTFGLKE